MYDLASHKQSSAESAAAHRAVRNLDSDPSPEEGHFVSSADDCFRRIPARRAMALGGEEEDIEEEEEAWKERDEEDEEEDEEEDDE